MKQLIITLVLLGATMNTNLYSQENSKAEVTFRASKAIWHVKGTFEKIESRISFHPNDLKNSKISGSAAVSSINTSVKMRDNSLQTEDWFNAKKYPKITISSEKIEAIGNHKYKGLFVITIKGTSKEKSINFEMVKQDGNKYLQTEFTLSLEEFKVGGGAMSYVVGDEVEVFLKMPF